MKNMEGNRPDQFKGPKGTLKMGGVGPQTQMDQMHAFMQNNPKATPDTSKDTKEIPIDVDLTALNSNITESKKNISSEKSKENLNKLLWNIITTVNSKHKIKDIIADNTLTTSEFINTQKNAIQTRLDLQNKLQAFANKNPADLSQDEQNNLKSLIATCNSETYFEYDAKNYNEKSKTSMDRTIENFDYFSSNMKSEMDSIRAEISVLENSETPNYSGNVDLKKFKTGLEGVNENDKNTLLLKLKNELTESTAIYDQISLKRSNILSDYIKNEPSLRNSEKVMSVAAVNLDKEKDIIKAKFASIL